MVSPNSNYERIIPCGIASSARRPRVIIPLAVRQCKETRMRERERERM